MKVIIHSIELTNELIWLKVLEDCNLDHYLVMDTTYADDSHISNEHRHIYWFPPKDVEMGDWIKLYTHSGRNTVFTNDDETKTHVFYWGLGSNVWNNSGDAAVLFEVNTWHTVKAKV